MAQAVPAEKYLEVGAHLGAEFNTGYMKRFVFKTRSDGLKILNIETIDNRIQTVAKFLAQFDPKEIVFVSRRSYGQKPVKVCANTLGANVVAGRFLPGLFTNPRAREFMEPRIVVITDPLADKQALSEAQKIGATIVSLCTTMNKVKNVDLIIPVNNKGKRSLALIYWALTGLILKEKGAIKSLEDFSKSPDDFEHVSVYTKRRKRPDDRRGGRRKPTTNKRRR